MSQIHLCNFTSLSDLRGKDRTYENMKAVALKAGKFSVFDAETNKDGRLLTALCRDPEIEVVKMSFPWTGVKLKKSNSSQV